MNSPKSIKKVYIVGAGPGDPDLLTVKALRLINSADVILHDDLVSEGILRLANENCLLISAGKRAGDGLNQDIRQKNIINTLLQYADAGKLIIRLKGGDPMIFGRGVEEYLELKSNNIEVEIVPGITASIAAGSLGVISLTERKKVGSLLITTGSTISSFSREPGLIVDTLKTGNTAILYMGHTHLSELKELCSQNNIENDLPVVVVSNVSMPDQKIVCGTVNSIEKLLLENQMKRPMIFFVGRNVKNISEMFQ
jgi:uroporphyrin-III C-methyltransferase